MVAVYVVAPANELAAGDHVTVPVYWVVSVIADTGGAPVTGAVTPGIATMLIAVSGWQITVHPKVNKTDC